MTVKHRNPILVIIFWFITAGIYGIYWLISTASELKRLKAKNAPEPIWVLWILLCSLGGIILLIAGIVMMAFLLAIGLPSLLIGMLLIIVAVVLSIIFYWRYSLAIDYISKGEYNYILLFVFWIIFSPVSVVLSQLALNRIAKKKRKK